MAGFVSPRLDIKFEPGEGANNLAIVGPNGKQFVTYSELVDRLEVSEERVDVERKQIEAEREQKEAERQQKEAERERAERYAAKLRALGIEPD
jgi:hypothetical protein